MDWQGENLIDYTNGIYQCPACKEEFTLDDNNTMEYEEFIKEEIINEYLKEHRHGVLLNPYAGLLDFAKYLDEHSELPEGLEEAALLYSSPMGRKDPEHLEEYPYSPADKAAFIAGAEWQKAKILEWAKERYQQTISNVGCYTGHSVWTEVIEHIDEM